MPGKKRRKKKKGKDLGERRGEMFTVRSCKLSRLHFSILLVAVVSYLVNALSVCLT